ncbi:hypothetical protein [Enemella evansiae]|uniref:hypothetical protein n=1 Tax=Enemella evansiae TaxID=2016499 RepID=UPI000B960970|nr:hypothetical protein [Enemella evansiae]OYO01500.1 hypothetical protein CGZ95_06875 [Enemella evansiae]OYO03935.1 hypothetical protein CGZ97_11105 [Enemella evansiae]
MPEYVSRRLVEQRLRNRVIEVLEILADGIDGLFTVGGTEYFELFFDYIDDDSPHDWRALSTYTAAEVDKLAALLVVMLEAVDRTQTLSTEDEIAGSGWPDRIQPIAHEALSTMLERGRFDEEREETEPSSSRRR